MNLQPAEQRRLRQREGAQRAILDATEALLVEEGYDAFSMRKLAERCGYTPPTIYHYFGDKRGLIDALLEERFQKLYDRLRRVRLGDDPVQNIRELARAFVRFGLRNPVHYRLLYAPRPSGVKPPPSREALLELGEGMLRSLAEEGRLRLEVKAANQALFVTLHGVISLRNESADIEWVAGLPDLAIESMLRGLVRGVPEGEGRAE